MRCVYFLVTFVAITLTSKEKNSIFYTAKILSMLNPFSTNVPLIDKPGSWFLPVKCFKHFASKNQLHSGTLVENGLMSASLTHLFPLHLFINPWKHQPRILKHSIQKSMFSVLRKLNSVKLGRRGVLFPSTPLVATCLALHLKRILRSESHKKGNSWGIARIKIMTVLLKNTFVTSLDILGFLIQKMRQLYHQFIGCVN